MGVLDRILRRSKATEEASTAEAQADRQTAEPLTADTTDEVSETDAGAGVQEAAGTTATEAVEAADGVEIPKQQSAEEAADNEAGEGART
ncbi:hypothetical protein JHN63_41455 [Streptomyces sp. MBT65]|uniref:hypothetical protein n=1 Tax=Streptomyces sp. MBT65 TaxID=1488395 RepID=UPI00190D36BF|nr:hypothetical protein [Streptomyces sp. MBT65]MBK3580150.1 hypothetical protein [Streptomyces sp. MBT65]